MLETGQDTLYPLDTFYPAGDARIPRAERIEPADMPEPYHGLLVHENDMTPTLEAHHDDLIHVHALHVKHEDGIYAREVILECDRDDRPVEYGAIRIHLEHFPEAAAERVAGAHQPLGGILAEFEIPHHSEPSGFYRFTGAGFIQDLLCCEGKVLYGRTNRLLNPQGLPLAEVLEILPVEI